MARKHAGKQRGGEEGGQGGSQGAGQGGRDRQDVRPDEERSRSAGAEQEYGAGYAGGYGRSGGYGTEGGDGDFEAGADAGEVGGTEAEPDGGIEQEM